MKSIILFLILLFYFSYSYCQLSYNELTTDQEKLYNEHIFGGQPDNNKILVRTAYINNYNEEYRIPNWSAYHIIPDYLKTPDRDGRFLSFRNDPDVSDPVNKDEYIGLFSSQNYARGHYAPYKILGGDRDGDGAYAHINKNLSDIDEEKTVFEGNYMSNIAPQLHYGFNGSGGLWYDAERWIQNDVVKNGNKEIWVYSGGIINDTRFLEKVVSNEDIVVPDQFYKVVIMNNEGEFPDVLVFLFPHYGNKDDINEKSIFKYLVSVDYLEAITGLNFFNSYSQVIQEIHEKIVDTSTWDQYIN